MKTLIISAFLLIGSTLVAQNVVSTESNSLKAVKNFENISVTSTDKVAVVATDKKKYYSTLVRTVSVVKPEDKL